MNAWKCGQLQDVFSQQRRLVADPCGRAHPLTSPLCCLQRPTSVQLTATCDGWEMKATVKPGSSTDMALPSTEQVCVALQASLRCVTACRQSAFMHLTAQQWSPAADQARISKCYFWGIHRRRWHSHKAWRPLDVHGTELPSDRPRCCVSASSLPGWRRRQWACACRGWSCAWCSHAEHLAGVMPLGAGARFAQSPRAQEKLS